MKPSTKPYSSLRALFRKYDCGYRDVAPRIGMCLAAFSHKMSGKTDWTLTEAYRILDLFGIEHTRLPEFFPAKGVSE